LVFLNIISGVHDQDVIFVRRTKFDWKDGEIPIKGHGYTWSSQGTIDELVAKAEKREKELGINSSNKKVSERWQESINNMIDDDPEDQACLICSL